MRIKAAYEFSFVVVLLFCLFVISCANEVSVREDVLQVENSWVKAFNDMDVKLMSSLYWQSTKTQLYSPNVFSEDWSVDGSSPFPTVLCNGLDSIKAVLEGYCEQPKGVYKWSLRDTQITVLKEDVAQVIGYHDLSKKPSDGGEVSSVSLRFTHLVQKIGKKWLIVYSHETKLQPARPPISPDGEGAVPGEAGPGQPPAAGPAGADPAEPPVAE